MDLRSIISRPRRLRRVPRFRTVAIALAAILLTVAGLTALGTGPASADTTATGATLTTTIASAPVGTEIPFTYTVSGPQVNAGNNILWYPAGTSPTASNYASYENNNSEVYFSNASGTVDSPTNNLSPGTYNVYIVADNEYAVLAGPVTVTLTSGGSVVTTAPVNASPTQTGATLTAEAGTVVVGSPAAFDYTLPPGALHSETVWIGWYPSGDSPTDEATYQDDLSNSQDVTTTSGTATFTTSSLSAGSYDVYLLSNTSTYDVLAGPVAITLTDTAPVAPSGVTATGYDTTAAVSWNAVSAASGYSVYDATTSGGEDTTGTPACTTTSATTCTVSGLTNGKTYYFVVVATNPVGSSPASSEASATPTPASTPPSAPAGLIATPTGSAGVVNLSWNAVTDASGYSVYDATTSGGEDTAGTPACTTTSATTCIITGLTDGTEYYFVVVATNSAGPSGDSTEASATPTAIPTATGVGGALLQTPSASVTSGSPVTFTYSVGTGTASSSNTVAWWNSGTNPTSTAPLYVLNQPAKSTSGTVAFDTTGLEAGSYDVYFMSSSNTSVLAGPLTVTVTGGTPQEPSPGQLAGQPNLIVNGGAEIGTPSTDGVDVTTVPGWRVNGTLTEVKYGTSGYPGFNTSGSADRGADFFTLANASGTSATGTQTVSVAAASKAIDHGSVTYNLGGWLGGQGTATGTASVTATFVGQHGNQLGSATIGPVTEADRGGQTEFLPEHAAGKLPAGTRRVQIVLTITSEVVGDSGEQGIADNLSFTISSPVPAPAPAPGVVVASQVPKFQHVFVVMFENEAESDIIGNTAQAPYLNSLLSQGADLTSMHALSHPSDGNYNAIISGGEWGSAGDNYTPFINEPTIGDLASNAGETWRSYIQSANGPCDAEGSTGSGPTLYDVDESPFIHFDDLGSDQDACQEHVQPLTSLATDLKSAATTPNYVWFVANDYYDMEGGGIKAGDTWFSQTLPEILNSPAWTKQRSLLIITFDEDAHDTPTNNIPTIILGSQGTVIPGSTSSTYYTSYSLLRTAEEALNLPSLTDNDLYAGPVTGIWNPRDLR